MPRASSATAFARNYDGSGRLYVAKVMPAALAAATTFAYDTPGHVHDAPGHLLLPITGASNGWGSPTAAVAVSTGLPTSSCTIVRNSYGELVTMSRG